MRREIPIRSRSSVEIIIAYRLRSIVILHNGADSDLIGVMPTLNLVSSLKPDDLGGAAQIIPTAIGLS